MVARGCRAAWVVGLGAVAAVGAVAVVLGLGLAGCGARGRAVNPPPAGGGLTVVRPWAGAGDPLAWIFDATAPSRRLAGRVIDEHGAPLAGVPVGAAPEVLDDPAPWVVGQSDAAGRFDLGAWPAGTWVVWAQHRGARGQLSVDLDDPRELPAPDRLELALGPCERWVAGQVVDVNGLPIAGARVHGRGAGLDADSDGAGRFVACAARWRITGAGYAPRHVDGGRAADRPVQVTLVPAATVTGRVTDAAGRPLAGALVHVGHDDEEVATDAAGVYAVKVAPGRVVLDVRWHGREGVGRFTVPAAGKADADVTIDGPCRRVRGVVRRGGQPVAGVAIGGAFSQADGGFAVACPGATLSVGAGGDELEVAVPAGDADVSELVVELPAPAHLGGEVLRDGRGVAGVWIMNGAQALAVTGAGGRFEADGLLPGEYDLWVRDRAAGDVDAHEVVLGAGDRTGVVFTLAPAVTVRGRLVDRAGRPRAGRVKLTCGARRAVTQAGDDGAFRVVAGRRGACTVAAMDSGSKADAVELMLADDAGATLVLDRDLVWSRPDEDVGTVRRLSGVVVDVAGSPVAGAVVSAGAQSVRSDAAGRFSFRAQVDARRPVITVVGRDGAMADVEPDGGEYAAVLPRLRALTVRWSGAPAGLRLTVEVTCGAWSWQQRVAVDVAEVFVPDVPRGSQVSCTVWIGAPGYRAYEYVEAEADVLTLAVERDAAGAGGGR